MSQLTQGLEAWLQNHPRECMYDDERWFTKEDLARDIAQARRLLWAAHIQPGDTVVLGYPNSYAFTVIYFALLYHGATVAPVNPGMAPAELYAFLSRSQAVAAFLLDGHWQAIQDGNEVEGAANHSLRTVFVAGPADQPTAVGTFSYQNTGFVPQVLALPQESMMAREPAEDDLAILLYTSGTTGRPKAVGLTHHHVYLTAQNVITSHQLTDADVTYCFLPLFHINAQVVALLSTCLSDGRIVIGAKFSAKRFWSTVVEHGITWVSAVPTVIAILLSRPAPERVPSHLRFIRSASAQLPAQHEREFERAFGVPIIQSYGMTEAASQICVNPLPPGKKRVGSVGVPVGLDLQIFDEYSHQLTPGQVGEIVIRGDNVIDSYVQADSHTDFQEGWFHTGDLGYQDEAGYVYLVGRRKEMINRAGEKISPYEVEDVIRQHASVNQVAVIGVPDDFYGERVAAYVISDTKAREHERLIAEILTHCRIQLSNFKVPSEVYVVSEIPLGPTGKIQRARLKKQVIELRQSG